MESQDTAGNQDKKNGGGGVKETKDGMCKIIYKRLTTSPTRGSVTKSIPNLSTIIVIFHFTKRCKYSGRRFTALLSKLYKQRCSNLKKKLYLYNLISLQINYSTNTHTLTVTLLLKV